MAHLAAKPFDTPGETRTIPRGKIDLVQLEGVTFGRAVLQPGWKWSECVKPLAKTESCQAPHTTYIVSGRMHVRMDDGTERELQAGEAAVIPPGHDAWIVGDQPCVAIDFTGMPEYAKER
jgi:hypothetical protein